MSTRGSTSRDAGRLRGIFGRGNSSGNTRTDERTDEAGQALPFTRAQFERAVRGAKYGALSSRAAQITIAGAPYVAKRMPDLSAVVYSPADRAAYQSGSATSEVAAARVARVVGMSDAVPQAFHLAATSRRGETTHYTVQPLVNLPTLGPGGLYPYRVHSARATAFRDAVQADPRHLLLEYVLGRADGNPSNILFGAGTGRIVHVDHHDDFQASTRYHTDVSAMVKALRYALRPQFGPRWAATVPIPHEAIRAFTSRAGQIEQMVRATKGANSPALTPLTQRLAVVQTLGQVREPTLGDLMRLARLAQ